MALKKDSSLTVATSLSAAEFFRICFNKTGTPSSQIVGYNTLMTELVTDMLGAVAVGDIFYANSATTVVRLAKSTTGYPLVAGTSLPQYGGSILVDGTLNVSGFATFKNPAETVQTLSDAGTTSWNMNGGAAAAWTLGASRTMGTPTNIRGGATYVLKVIQGGGTYAITWPGAVFKWAGSITPTLSAASAAIDLYSFYSPDGTVLYGSSLKAFA